MSHEDHLEMNQIRKLLDVISSLIHPQTSSFSYKTYHLLLATVVAKGILHICLRIEYRT
jgi:hypothetical protein